MLSKTNFSAKKMVLAGMMLALTILLPFLTGQIPQFGYMLLPMHIPVLICGFVCGWPYALIIGAISPILRFFMFGMPPLFPTGTAMVFELATYGAATGIFYSRVKKTGIVGIYASLIGAMIAGRAVWGTVMFLLSKVAMVKFSFSIFIAGAFANAIPGIILQILLIPIVIMALEKAGYTMTYKKHAVAKVGYTTRD